MFSSHVNLHFEPALSLKLYQQQENTTVWWFEYAGQVYFANGSFVCPRGYILSLAGATATGEERSGEGTCVFCQVLLCSSCHRCSWDSRVWTSIVLKWIHLTEYSFAGWDVFSQSSCRIQWRKLSLHSVPLWSVLWWGCSSNLQLWLLASICRNIPPGWLPTWKCPCQRHWWRLFSWCTKVCLLPVLAFTSVHVCTVLFVELCWCIMPADASHAGLPITYSTPIGLTLAASPARLAQRATASRWTAWWRDQPGWLIGRLACISSQAALQDSSSSTKLKVRFLRRVGARNDSLCTHPFLWVFSPVSRHEILVRDWDGQERIADCTNPQKQRIIMRTTKRRRKWRE